MTPEPTQSVTLHGRRLAYRRAGQGETVLLIHGITNSSLSWVPVIEHLSRDHDVIAPDLPGHGDSERHRGDHSLSAHAASLRDLLETLEVERATIVGHSLGGGIAMQFSYLFPEHIERLVLVCSGGLGREVSPIVRSAALPLAEQVIPLLTYRRLLDAATTVGRVLGRFGFKPGPDLAEVSRGLESLGDVERRAAFVRTVRSVMSPRGQRVSALDRLYLAEEIPTLFVAGDRDPIIPADHARTAHRAVRGSRLEVFEGAGHFPQLDDPHRFSSLLSDFIGETDPALFDRGNLRERLLAGAAPAA